MLSLIKRFPDIYFYEIQEQLRDLHDVDVSLVCTPLLSISSSMPCAQPSTCVQAGEVVVLRGSDVGASHVDGVSHVERSWAGNVPITPLTQTSMAWVCRALSEVPA
jgi:hypothetical protein